MTAPRIGRTHSHRGSQLNSGTRFACRVLVAATVAVGIVNDSANAQSSPSQLSTGDVIVVDPGAATLFVVDPSTGARSVISDFGDPLKGPSGRPFAVAVTAPDNVFVLAQDPGGLGVVIRVDPTDGMRTIFSDFADVSQGPRGGCFPFDTCLPAEMTADRDGNLLVLHENGLVYFVDQFTGHRSISLC